jgi:hypothetical protein
MQMVQDKGGICTRENLKKKYVKNSQPENSMMNIQSEMQAFYVIRGSTVVFIRAMQMTSLSFCEILEVSLMKA